MSSICLNGDEYVELEDYMNVMSDNESLTRRNEQLTAELIEANKFMRKKMDMIGEDLQALRQGSWTPPDA